MSVDSYKVALATRYTDQQLTNGDVVQMLKTKKYLEARHGLDVVVTRTPEEAAAADVDLVHVFSMPRIDDAAAFVDAARRTGKRVALSTVFWDLTHAGFVVACYDRGLLRWARSLRRWRAPAYRLYNVIMAARGARSRAFYSADYTETRRALLMAAGMILPNSIEELRLLSRDFGFGFEELMAKAVVVPNAVDLDVLRSPGRDPVPDLDRFVLCVASLDPVKNQIGLLRALFDVPDLWIVLRGTPRHPAYSEEVRALAARRGKVRILGELEDDQVATLYRKAAVHVLPSFRESTGLASLEALATGCEIVVADAPYCPIQWYKFDRFGHICDPYSTRSIRAAVLQSLSMKRNRVSEDYRHEYSYERAVDLTKEAYDRLMMRGNANLPCG